MRGLLEGARPTVSAASKRVLILGCTAKKRAMPGTHAQARDLYDGPCFSLFRRYDGRFPGAVRLFALSALHGLVGGDCQLEPYDCTLDDRYEETKRLVARQAADRAHGAFMADADIVAVMSNRYLGLISGAWEQAGMAVPIRSFEGRPGVRLSRLRQWLYGEPETGNGPRSGGPKTPRIRGIDVSFTEEQAISRLQAALAQGSEAPLRIGAWSVSVAGKAVAPKWLIREFSGLKVSQFHTHDALRVLRQLGFLTSQVTA